jgi:hypothetical protein
VASATHLAGALTQCPASAAAGRSDRQPEWRASEGSTHRIAWARDGAGQRHAERAARTPSRIRLAAQGRDLLKDRRSALVHEFHRLGASVLESMDALDRDAGDAGRFLGLSVAASGPEPLDSATFARRATSR